MPFVSTIATDQRVFHGPTVADMEREIRALDAKTSTLVVLAPAPPLGAPEGSSHLAVGGGEGGRFIVYFTEDNLEFWNLADHERAMDGRRLMVNIGGQEGEYFESQFVSFEKAMAAAFRYFKDGRRDPRLIWIQDK